MKGKMTKPVRPAKTVPMQDPKIAAQAQSLPFLKPKTAMKKKK